MKAPNLTCFLAGALLLAGALACGTSQKAGRDPEPAALLTQVSSDRGPAIVTGTTIEAASGTPLSGVLIEGPSGTQAYSDEKGRFELRGLSVGESGELIASNGEELRGKVRLRPLTGGELEVVLYLR